MAVVSAQYIKEKMEVAPPKIIEEAEVPSSPVSPSMNKNVMMGALAGFALAAAIVILFAIMNDSIKTEDDIERALGIPTLAVIPDRKDYIDDHGGSKKKKGKRRRQSKWRNKKVIMTDPRQEDYFYQEAIKTLRTNIQFAGMDVKTILFTSCYPNEGKSDITFQLSQEIGKLGKKVLLLDADIRKSILASRYGVGKQVQGLSNYLSGQASIAEIIYRTNYENMDIIFSGSFAPNPSELLGQEAFGTLLGAVREHYDYIIVDTPPIGSIIDAAIVAKQCDGAVLVFESELVSSKEAARVKEQLLMTGCRLIGAVLNKVDVKKNKYYHRYDYYYHGYQEKKEVTKKNKEK